MKPWSDKKIARWKKIQSGGKWMFALKFGLKFLLVLTPIFLLLNWLLNRRVEVDAFSVVLTVLLSILAGLDTWRDNNADYQNQILDEKIKKSMEVSTQ